MSHSVSGYSELWVCFKTPLTTPQPQVLVLSFMPSNEERETERQWAAQFMSGREIAQEVRAEARKAYVDLIARIAATPIGGKTLRQALKGEGGFSRWWLHKTSEKDCVWDHDVTYTTVIRLMCVKRVASQHGLKRVRLIGASPEFSLVLSKVFEVMSPSSLPKNAGLTKILCLGLLSRLSALVFYLRLWWILKLCPLQPRIHCDVVLEAHWDWSVRLHEDGNLEDRYFADLPVKLRERGATIRWLAWCEPQSEVWQRGRSLKAVVAVASHCPEVVILENYLTLFEICSTVLNFRYLIEYFRFDRSDAFRKLFIVDGFDLFPLIRKQLIQLFSDSSICRQELLARSTHRACSEIRPKMLLTFLELFVHSRAMYAGARLYAPELVIWVAQHAGYSSDKTFGVVDPVKELQGEPDGCPMPAPDGIFVMGELSGKIWQGSGFPQERVLVTGGLRYQHIRTAKASRPAQPKARQSLLLVVGMNEELDLDMCAAVTAAVAGLPKVDVLLRDHPQYCLSERTGFRPFRHRIEVTKGRVDKDLEQADLVIFTHSGLAEEALLRGIPTWQWLWAGFNTSAFLDLPVIPVFTSISDLRQALCSFVEGPEKYKPQREVQEMVLRQCFGPSPEHASICIADKIMELIRVDNRNTNAARPIAMHR